MGKLRQLYLQSPMRRHALKLADAGDGEKWCKKCGQSLPKELVQVDHVEPVIPLEGRDSWDGVIARLFFGEVQVLCKTCHSIKTHTENKKRS